MPKNFTRCCDTLNILLVIVICFFGIYSLNISISIGPLCINFFYLFSLDTVRYFHYFSAKRQPSSTSRFSLLALAVDYILIHSVVILVPSRITGVERETITIGTFGLIECLHLWQSSHFLTKSLISRFICGLTYAFRSVRKLTIDTSLSTRRLDMCFFHSCHIFIHFTNRLAHLTIRIFMLHFAIMASSIAHLFHNVVTSREWINTSLMCKLFLIIFHSIFLILFIFSSNKFCAEKYATLLLAVTITSFIWLMSISLLYLLLSLITLSLSYLSLLFFSLSYLVKSTESSTNSTSTKPFG